MEKDLAGIPSFSQIVVSWLYIFINSTVWKSPFYNLYAQTMFQAFPFDRTRGIDCASICEFNTDHLQLNNSASHTPISKCPSFK